MSETKGFTLIEVLIALVIIAIAFAAVMSSVNSASRNFIHLKNTTASTWVASNVIANAQLNRITNLTSGFENMLGQDWRWTMQFKDTPNPNIREVEVTVFDAQTGKSATKLTGFLGG